MSDRLKQLEALLADDQDNSFVKFAIAKEYEGMQSDKIALEKYNALKADDPAYVGLYYHLAKLLEKQEDYDGAMATYKEGMNQAKAQGDKHAYGEMESALWEIEPD